VGDSYHDDKFFDLRADYVVSNPPFNDSGWGADRVKHDDSRFKYGIPPDNNGNFAWIQHYIYHLAPDDKAGFMMADGALSGGNAEGEIRKKLIKDDLVYGIVACPPKLFYNVSLPVSLRFLRKNKPEDMKEKVLSINAKDLYTQISRRQNEMRDEHIARIVDKFRLFEDGELEKVDETGFAKVATAEKIAKNGHVPTPGRYVGVKLELDDESFDEKMRVYSEEVSKLLKEEGELSEKVRGIFEALGYGLDAYGT